MKEIGERVKRRRMELGLTQKQVAKEAGITYPTLLAVEKGRHVMPGKLLAILQVLGLTIKLNEAQ